MTDILLIIIAVLLAVRIVWLIRCKMRKQTKYQLGDKVRFAYDVIGSAYVHIGKIWKIQKYLLSEPTYSIYYSFGDGTTGNSYNITESDIIELIDRTGETPTNPFEPKHK